MDIITEWARLGWVKIGRSQESFSTIQIFPTYGAVHCGFSATVSEETVDNFIRYARTAVSDMDKATKDLVNALKKKFGTVEVTEEKPVVMGYPDVEYDQVVLIWGKTMIKMDHSFEKEGELVRKIVVDLLKKGRWTPR